jgi:hypothetical protein
VISRQLFSFDWQRPFSSKYRPHRKGGLICRQALFYPTVKRPKYQYAGLTLFFTFHGF